MYKVKVKLKGDGGKAREMEVYSTGSRPSEKKVKELVAEKLSISVKDVYTVQKIERV